MKILIMSEKPELVGPLGLRSHAKRFILECGGETVFTRFGRDLCVCVCVRGGKGGRVNSQGSQLGYDLLFLLGESVFKYSEIYLAYIDRYSLVFY